ncbi:MAG TPA: hypothetical protein VD884_22900 [Ohtaekwangia sp.]|nr:hypothetical protein [Ohtaekwangia sp.]
MSSFSSLIRINIFRRPGRVFVIPTYVSNLYFRLTHWETWHWLVKYIPLVPAWIWFCIRARSLWFFTSSNPTLTFGGYEGEGKMEMYHQLPPGSYPKSKLICPALSLHEIENLFMQDEFHFPIAVKPDVGRMGLLFRKIDNMSQLRSYHSKIHVDYIIQEFVTYPVEVSVFYYRFPDQQNGTITGFVKKEPLQVKGDGRSTLKELIESYPRTRFRLDEMFKKHAGQLQDVIPANQIFYLSEALNLSRGGKLVNLDNEKDDNLHAVLDGLSHYTGFYYGRYDIKCSSVADFKAGKNFSILEFNGCGAEPHHIYGNENTLYQALAEILNHWAVLFKISRYNQRNGTCHWPFLAGLKHLQNAGKHFRQVKKLELHQDLIHG